MRRAAGRLATALLLASAPAAQAAAQALSPAAALAAVADPQVGTLATPGRAGGPPRSAPLQPTAAISGRVVVAGTTTPVRGAEVRVRASDGRENRLATTDSQGRYDVRDLLPGSWVVTASKAGFISQQYGQRRPLEAVKPIDIGAGERATANLELTRGGAISGRIYDEFGDPVAGVRVQVLRQRMNGQGRKELASTGVADQTDDTGTFRVFALPPGAYYVSAALRAGAADTSIVDIAATAPTYYPGAAGLSEAQKILLGAGEEQGNVSFQLTPVRAVRVSGMLLTSSGAAADMAQLTLRSAVDTGAMTYAVGNFGVVQPDGSFTIVNVPPGSYTLTAQGQPGMLQAMTGQRAAGPPSEQREYATVPLTVGTENISGLTVAMTKGASASITVVTDPGSVLPANAGLQITAQSSSGMTMMNGRQGGARAFSLYGLAPDQWTFGVDGLPDGWAVRSIEINGLEIDGPTDLKSGEQAAVRIVITDRTTDLGGLVTGRGQPAANVAVVIFPEDPARWTFRSRYVRSVRTDDQGRFRVRGLPPGQRYMAVAIDYLEDGEFQDPDLLEQLKPVASGFSIGDAERKTVNLRLATR